MMMRMSPIAVLLAGALAGCGGSEATEPAAPEPTYVPPTDHRPPPEPIVGHGDGPSCDQGRSDWLAANTARSEEAPDEHKEAIKEQLNRGTYLNDCSVPPSSAVKICAAIVDGAAVGVTVTLAPGEQGQADCVADSIRRMEFSEHGDLAVATTTFEPSL